MGMPILKGISRHPLQASRQQRASPCRPYYYLALGGTLLPEAAFYVSAWFSSARLCKQSLQISLGDIISVWMRNIGPCE